MKELRLWREIQNENEFQGDDYGEKFTRQFADVMSGGVFLKP